MDIFLNLTLFDRHVVTGAYPHAMYNQKEEK
jgi:hypothetical protein